MTYTEFYELADEVRDSMTDEQIKDEINILEGNEGGDSFRLDTLYFALYQDIKYVQGLWDENY